MGWFSGLHPVMQGFLATMFTYAVTVLGASLVFFIKRMNQKVMDVMMGFAAGVMIAASYWSLLEPAIAQAEQQQDFCWAECLLWYLISSWQRSSVPRRGAMDGGAAYC